MELKLEFCNLATHSQDKAPDRRFGDQKSVLNNPVEIGLYENRA